MPTICYVDKKFTVGSVAVINQAVKIIVEYRQQGLKLTLRQLYYQFVSRDIFPEDRTWSWTGSRWVRDPNGTRNATPNYKWLGGIINDARLAGYIDWDAFEDRTRFIREQWHWDNPAEIVMACAEGYQWSFRLDKWAPQHDRVEVWIEKDALTGVIEKPCQDNDTAFFSCRGYVSQSEMWGAARRMIPYIQAGQKVTVLHLGDHDPSGLDMTRDIRDRLCLFLEHEGCTYGDDFEIDRIALTMAQIKKYKPPPNPTKLTDVRAPGYVAKYGPDSWELDALDPKTMSKLIRRSIEALRDEAKWEDAEVEEEEGRARLREIAEELKEE